MADRTIQTESLISIADAIRNKTGKSDSLTITDMVYEINNIDIGEGFKKWIVTVSEEISETNVITLLTDQWVADKCDNDNLEVSIRNLSRPDTSGTSIYFMYSSGRNTPYTLNTIHQIGVRMGNNNHYAISHTTKLSNAKMNSRGMIGVFSTGEVKIRADAACMLSAGEYEILARII